MGGRRLCRCESVRDWPVYKVRCPPVGRRWNPSYKFLHRNHLLLVSPEDVSDEVQDNAQPSMDTPAISNATLRAFLVVVDSPESERAITFPGDSTGG